MHSHLSLVRTALGLYRRRLAASVLISLVPAVVVFASLWANPKQLSDAAEYALVQPMVETLLGTAFEVSAFVVATVLAVAIVGLTFELTTSGTARVKTGHMLGLFLPVGASLVVITTSFLFRIWVGYASFDWTQPYLDVAIPMIAVLVFGMMFQLVLLGCGLFDVAIPLARDRPIAPQSVAHPPEPDGSAHLAPPPGR